MLSAAGFLATVSIWFGSWQTSRGIEARLREEEHRIEVETPGPRITVSQDTTVPSGLGITAADIRSAVAGEESARIATDRAERLRVLRGVRAQLTTATFPSHAYARVALLTAVLPVIWTL